MGEERAYGEYAALRVVYLHHFKKIEEENVRLLAEVQKWTEVARDERNRRTTECPQCFGHHHFTMVNPVANRAMGFFYICPENTRAPNWTQNVVTTVMDDPSQLTPLP